MSEAYIVLKTIQDVREFVNIVIAFEYEIDLVQGRYVIDAKSIMGIFSLDLSKEIKLVIHSDDAEAFIKEIKPFIVK